MHDAHQQPEPQQTPDSEKKSRDIQFARWGLQYLYQFASMNPFLAVLIALIIIVIFSIVVPVGISKLFLLP